MTTPPYYPYNNNNQFMMYPMFMPYPQNMQGYQIKVEDNFSEKQINSTNLSISNFCLLSLNLSIFNSYLLL